MLLFSPFSLIFFFHNPHTTQSAEKLTLPNRPHTPLYTLLATSPPGGKQVGRANEPDFVAILLTMIRLKDQKTDILVTVNVPHVKGSYEAGSVDLEHGKMGKLLEKAVEWRQKVLGSFEVREWGLFGEE